MKKFFKALALVFVGLLALTSCGNKWAPIQKAFEKEGFVLSSTVEQLAASVEKELKADDESKEIAFTVHAMNKSLSIVVILEFKSTKDLQTACEDSETLKGIVKDSQKSDYVNGKCVLLLGNSSALEIFKNA